jgi:hypothetical protein
MLQNVCRCHCSIIRTSLPCLFISLLVSVGPLQSRVMELPYSQSFEADSQLKQTSISEQARQLIRYLS